MLHSYTGLPLYISTHLNNRTNREVHRQLIHTSFLNDDQRRLSIINKMISDSGERNSFLAKQEGDNTTNEGRLMISNKSTSSSSRQWTSAFRNPRIVRVSRMSGGKDRHSKVCTVRGLRDRRIRLSVPTAIQLYDLQDKLGLSQPSKVIDWLLEAAKSDVDQLPPLQLPQGFGQLYPNLMFNTAHETSNSATISNGDQAIRHNWEMGGASLRPRSYQEMEKENFALDKGKWIEFDDHQNENNQDGIDHFSSSGQSLGQNKFSPSLINNPTIAYNSYYHLNPSSLSLSQFGGHNHVSQAEASTNSSAMNNPIIPSAGSQLLFCPPATRTSLFPTYHPFVIPQFGDANENCRQSNHFQLLSSRAQQIPQNSNMKPFHQLLNVNPGFADLQRNDEDKPDNDDSDS